MPNRAHSPASVHHGAVRAGSRRINAHSTTAKDTYAIIVDQRHHTDSGTAITNTFSPIDARHLRFTIEGVHPLSYTGSSVSIKAFKVFGS